MTHRFKVKDFVFAKIHGLPWNRGAASLHGNLIPPVTTVSVIEKIVFRNSKTYYMVWAKGNFSFHQENELTEIKSELTEIK